MEEVRAGYLHGLWMGYPAPSLATFPFEVGFGDKAAEVVL